MGTINKYTPEEILAIFQANYLQQQQFDPEIDPGESLELETTIEEWINICDLSEPYELSDYFNYFFDLDFSMETWLYVMQPKNKKTLGELCNFISEEAFKPVIVPIKVFGSDCRNAATFKHLISQFSKKGIDAKIQPSSSVESFAKKHLGILIEEVNKLNPETLPPVKYRENAWQNLGGYCLLFCVLTAIASIWISNLGLIIGGLFGTGILFYWIGSRFEPKQMSFDGLVTFKDLVLKINNA
ncbi:MAG: hypothetical protein HOP10_15950 [Chitinophagaceae bacterium]|nr:hypothetical protein [Chitinophagaceae bacterium]